MYIFAKNNKKIFKSIAINKIMCYNLISWKVYDIYSIKPTKDINRGSNMYYVSNTYSK